MERSILLAVACGLRLIFEVLTLEVNEGECIKATFGKISKWFLIYTVLYLYFC